jgi:xanthine dehydrogenase YagS FAD-binding subunit
MQKFEYASPTTKEQAVALLGKEWGETEVLAGGTDLLSLMKDFIVTPKRVVNIKGIKELDGVMTPRDGSARIGALATIERVIEVLGRGFPAVTQAASGITSPQIRNMGTVGGDLCQRPRCWYYRAGYGLMAKGENGEPLVPKGDNRYHAILGNDGPAYFVSASSLAPAFVALNAKIKILGPGGEREIDAEKFFVIPKSDNEREYALKSNEIVTGIFIPRTLAFAIRLMKYGKRSHSTGLLPLLRWLFRLIPPKRSRLRVSFWATWRRSPGSPMKLRNFWSAKRSMRMSPRKQASLLWRMPNR